MVSGLNRFLIAVLMVSVSLAGCSKNKSAQPQVTSPTAVATSSGETPSENSTEASEITETVVDAIANFEGMSQADLEKLFADIESGTVVLTQQMRESLALAAVTAQTQITKSMAEEEAALLGLTAAKGNSENDALWLAGSTAGFLALMAANDVFGSAWVQKQVGRELAENAARFELNLADRAIMQTITRESLKGVVSKNENQRKTNARRVRRFLATNFSELATKSKYQQALGKATQTALKTQLDRLANEKSAFASRARARATSAISFVTTTGVYLGVAFMGYNFVDLALSENEVANAQRAHQLALDNLGSERAKWDAIQKILNLSIDDAAGAIPFCEEDTLEFEIVEDLAVSTPSVSDPDMSDFPEEIDLVTPRLQN